MAYNFYRIDRDQALLMPPSLQEWLPPSDYVWFVIETVSRFDVSRFERKYRTDGHGHPAWPPRMMLTLLIYTYSCGERSSRKIEQMCERDVACRIICGNMKPDHTAIAVFRQRHNDELEKVFLDVLEVCKRSGLARAGQVAVDGTKVGANAAKDANQTQLTLVDTVAKILREAGVVDESDNRKFSGLRGDELPEALRDPKRRQETIAAIVAEMEREKPRPAAQDGKDQGGVRDNLRRRRKKDHAGARQGSLLSAESDESTKHPGSNRRSVAGQQLAEHLERAGVCLEQTAKIDAKRKADEDKRLAERQRKEAANGGKPLPGRKPKPPKIPEPGKANLTDPDSRLMKTQQQGFIQGYNAQAVVNRHQIILAADLSNACNDQHQLHPMIDQTVENLKAVGASPKIGVVLADAGYANERDFNKPLAGGGRPLVALGKCRDTLAAPPAQRGRMPADATATERMDRKLHTKEGKRLYGLRGQIVEPVFGHIKDCRRGRRFMRRGLAACRAEWRFMSAVHNLRKIFTSGHRTKQGTRGAAR